MVDPAHVYLRAAAGETATASLAVSAAASISLRAFDLDADGRPIAAANAGRSLLQWLTITQSGGTVDVTIDVPPEARGSYWGAVLVERKDAKTSGGPRFRVAVPIVVTVTRDEDPRFQIESLRATADGNEVLFSVVVRNLGNVALMPAISAALLNGDVEEATLDTSVLILPGHSRVVRMRLRPASKLAALVAAVFVKVGLDLQTAEQPVTSSDAEV